MLFAFVPAILAVIAFGEVRAESHTVHFSNGYRMRQPTLVHGSKIISTGADFTTHGPLSHAIAYLQRGSCGLHGENCTTVETTLKNGHSSAKISPFVTFVPMFKQSYVKFRYFNGRDGTGLDCMIYLSFRVMTCMTADDLQPALAQSVKLIVLPLMSTWRYCIFFWRCPETLL
ncbi:hypothetical protein C8J57DRAFT_1070290 [Mycena rebaudengoi]|nr:hypothetical protein C8J57DRAFT_1070290 [Mycena rebaudengoi]